VKKNKLVDLWPYKVKDRSLFYDRDHPINLHPKTKRYSEYWLDQLKKSIEGQWVNDKGTWVYMFPKLHFYVNISKIVLEDAKNKTRILNSPDLRDTEWIIFTYLFCCQGFSGFDEDDKYTSNRQVYLHNKGEEVELTNSCYDSNGHIKEYVDPWDYLREVYTIKDPQNRPLGLPLYENPTSDFFLLATRGCGKSFSLACGDALHEWCTSGIKYWEDRGKINQLPIEMFFGSAQSDKLQDFIKKFRKTYENLPGQYTEGESFFQSPFYKKTKGSWSARASSPVEHIYESSLGEKKGSGATIKFGTYTVENPEVAVGLRANRIYNEECGLNGNIEEVHGANVNSLLVDNKFGIEVNLGTGGNLDKVQGSKKLFMRPDAYSIFGIPNYWENPESKVGLFIPVEYRWNNLKDSNGNTLLEKARGRSDKTRLKKRDSIDLSAFDQELMYNPQVPSEIFLNVKNNILPVRQAAERVAEITTLDLWNKVSTIGELKRVGEEVIFVPDIRRRLTPINSWYTEKLLDKSGAIVVYEHPRDVNSDKSLYKVIYDPVKDEGDGTSFAAVVVYKDFHDFDGNAMKNTIVAEWVGRKQRLEEAHEIAIMMAEYYNTQMLPETNVGQVVQYCRRKNKMHLLRRFPGIATSKALDGKGKGNKYQVGFEMTNQFLKKTCEQWFKEWLLEPMTVDEDGQIKTRTIDHLYSTRLLEEIEHYNRKENCDIISCMFGLMLWLQEESEEPVREYSSKKMKKEYDDLFNTISLWT
jgi:hypothetical protein